MPTAKIYPKTNLRGATSTRLQSIDALRGLVMVLMLLDHLRETWFLHVPLADPVDAHTVSPLLYLARVAVSLCAPIFVALTGVSAFLFSTRHTMAETRSYLFRRGIVLMALEIFFISPIYWGIASPTLWLQVIWCIGVCMIVLALLIGIPRRFLLAGGLLIVFAHNLLDAIEITQGRPFFALWAMLHQRDIIELPFGLLAKTTYPVLPWIGVIVLGFAVGPWFLPVVGVDTRRRRLIGLGCAMLILFLLLRFLNVYGDTPWFTVDGNTMRTLMSFFSLTKYPPSLFFLLFTLGVGALLLAGLEQIRNSKIAASLAVFGGAPLFFYLFHLTVLRLLYHIALAIWGPTQGTVFGVENYGWVLFWYGLLIVPLYIPTAWFSRLKARRRDITWLKYF